MSANEFRRRVWHKYWWLAILIPLAILSEFSDLLVFPLNKLPEILKLLLACFLSWKLWGQWGADRSKLLVSRGFIVIAVLVVVLHVAAPYFTDDIWGEPGDFGHDVAMPVLTVGGKLITRTLPPGSENNYECQECHIGNRLKPVVAR